MNRQGPVSGPPTSLFCGVFYWMALISLGFGMLPRECFAFVGGGPKGDSLALSLSLSGGFLLFGIGLHVLFYRLDPERFDPRALRFVLCGMVGLTALFFGASYIMERGLGMTPAQVKGRFDVASRWLGMVAIGLGALIVGVLLPLLFVILRRNPANQMARCLQCGDVAGAVAIGEAIPPERRDLLVRMNLTAAHARAGNTPRAADMLAELEKAEELPGHVTRESFRQALDGLRTMIAQGPTDETRVDVGQES